MEEFLTFVITNLVDHPDEVIVSKHEHSRKVIFQVRLNEEDVGQVIGRNGMVIQAIRSLLSAAASRHGQRAVVEIVETRS